MNFKYEGGSYLQEFVTGATIVRESVGSYVVSFPDGSKEHYDMPDSVLVNNRRVFLTRIDDPQGRTTEIHYDGHFRVYAVSTVSGLTGLSITYCSDVPTASDFYRIQRVETHDGRAALFQYDTSGRLQYVTDAIGMMSEFKYDDPTDPNFIKEIVTPYGPTKFEKEENGRTSKIKATDPKGGIERVIFTETPPPEAGIDEDDIFVTGEGEEEEVDDRRPPMYVYTNAALTLRNSFYWSKLGRVCKMELGTSERGGVEGAQMKDIRLGLPDPLWDRLKKLS